MESLLDDLSSLGPESASLSNQRYSTTACPTLPPQNMVQRWGPRVCAPVSRSEPLVIHPFSILAEVTCCWSRALSGLCQREDGLHGHGSDAEVLSQFLFSPEQCRLPLTLLAGLTVRFVWVRIGLYHISHLGKKWHQEEYSVMWKDLISQLVKWWEIRVPTLCFQKPLTVLALPQDGLSNYLWKAYIFAFCKIILMIPKDTFQFFIEKVFLTAVWPKFFITICFPSLNM